MSTDTGSKRWCRLCLFVLWMHGFRLYSFCLLLGVGQNCGLWTKDGRSSAAPDLQRRQREGQVIHFVVQPQCGGKCLVISVAVTEYVVFRRSPTPHLHFSIKHPHTLSWEYYKMFQCKAHLVMRLIENRISMEFMLQASLDLSSSDHNCQNPSF